jgi:hypothetical protein
VVQRGEFVTLVATRARVQRFSDRIGHTNSTATTNGSTGTTTSATSPASMPNS